MPWRMILFLFFLAVFIIFSGFNTHLVDVNIGPLKLADVPMFVALFIAFLLGAVLTLPFSIMSMLRKRKLKTMPKNNQIPHKKSKEIPDNTNNAEEKPPTSEEDVKKVGKRKK